MSVASVQCCSVVAEASLCIIILHVVVTELRLNEHLLVRTVL